MTKQHTDAPGPAANTAPAANWSENFVQDHYKPHSYTTQDKQHHTHKHYGTTNADVDRAASEAAKGIKSDLKSGVTPSEDRDHFFTAKAGKDLGSLEEQARGAHTAAERAFAAKVLARTKTMLSQDKELQSLGFNKGDTILGTDGQNHLQVRSKDSRGVPQTRTEDNYGDTTRVENKGFRIGEDDKSKTDRVTGSNKGADFIADVTTDKKTGKELSSVTTYNTGNGQETVNGQQVNNVQKVTKTWNSDTNRYSVTMNTKDGDVSFTTDANGGDVQTKAPKPDDGKAVSGLNPAEAATATVPDPLLDGHNGVKRVTGVLNDKTTGMDPTSYTRTDFTNPDGGLKERDIHYDWSLLHGANGNTGKTELNVDGPNGPRKLTNISDVKYVFNGVGYDATFTSSDGTVTKGKTGADAKKIISWD